MTMVKKVQDFIQSLARVVSGSAKELERIDALARDESIHPYYRPMLMMKEFFHLEAGGGILLMLCAVLALIVANSGLGPLYETLLHDTKGIVGIGDLVFEKTIIHWINDGLMAIFFFVIGLEVKRELSTGMLSTWGQRLLPAIAAVGGMAVPALLYYAVVTCLADGQQAEQITAGWAIPAATDIAFAIGLFALLGQRLPTSLKAFLLTLAIIDDIGAVIIIALFYTSSLGLTQLAGAGVCLACLLLMNIMGIRSHAWYAIIGLVMWAFVVKSGVHATLAGVALAFTIPMRGEKDDKCMVTEFEHDLHPLVAFMVLPIFAFANAGVNLEGVTLASFLTPITLAIIVGLVMGKQIGIFGLTWLAVKLGFVKKPEGATFYQLWGVSILAGIGFTMSLFIGTLAFPGVENSFMLETKLGILTGSALSAIIGLTVLWFSTRNTKHN